MPFLVHFRLAQIDFKVLFHFTANSHYELLFVITFCQLENFPFCSVNRIHQSFIFFFFLSLWTNITAHSVTNSMSLIIICERKTEKRDRNNRENVRIIPLVISTLESILKFVITPFCLIWGELHFCCVNIIHQSFTFLILLHLIEHTSAFYKYVPHHNVRERKKRRNIEKCQKNYLGHISTLDSVPEQKLCFKSCYKHLSIGTRPTSPRKGGSVLNVAITRRTLKGVSIGVSILILNYI